MSLPYQLSSAHSCSVLPDWYFTFDFRWSWYSTCERNLCYLCVMNMICAHTVQGKLHESVFLNDLNLCQDIKECQKEYQKSTQRGTISLCIKHVHRVCKIFSQHLGSLVYIVDRPATPKFRFNQPANNMDNFCNLGPMWRYSAEKVHIICRFIKLP